MYMVPKSAHPKGKKQRHPVYHDYHGASDEWIHHRWKELQKAHGAGAVGVATRKFPLRLHQLLAAVDGTNQSTLVRWLPHGRAFVVLDKTRFVKEVLPLHFPSQPGYSTFQRQLIANGFLRASREGEGYYHELFLRSRPVLAILMSRPGQGRQSATRQKLDPATEPDFYAMPWLPDIEHLSVEKGATPDGQLHDGKPKEEASQRTGSGGPIYYVPRSLPLSSQLPRPIHNKFTSLRNYTECTESIGLYAMDTTRADLPKNLGSCVIQRRLAASSDTSPLPFGHSVMTTIASRPQHAPLVTPNDPYPQIVYCLSDVPFAPMHHAPLSAPTIATFEIEDDLETIGPSSPKRMRSVKLAEWADFLHDVDL